MGVATAVIWIFVGIFYVAHRGFLQSIGSKIMSAICVVLCAAGVVVVAIAGHLSDSLTVGFLMATGLIELLAVVLDKHGNSANVGLCKLVSIVLLPLVSINGLIELLLDQRPWLLLIIVPSVLYFIALIREVIEGNNHAYKKKLDNEVSQKDYAGEKRELDIRSEVEQLFPSQEQANDIIKRYHLSGYHSPYSMEVIRRWRDEELKRRMDENNKKG